MLTNLAENANAAFTDLIAREEITLVVDGKEFHIIADDWTVVIVGEPASAVLVALDDESGDPAAMLNEAMSADDLAALSTLDTTTSGMIQTLLAASPDPLAQALAIMLRT